MPRYDPDLIAALAEGRLDPEEAARLEREIASDPEALEALQAQRTAITALAAAVSPALTEIERAGLRASIADALGLAEPEPVAASSSPRRVPWGSLGIATAALIGLVAIVPVVGLLNTGDNDASTAIELAPETSTSSQTDSSAADRDDAGADAQGEAAPEAALTDDGSFQEDEAPGNTFLGFGSTTTQPARVTTTDADDGSTTTSAPTEESTSTTAAASTTTTTTTTVDEATTTTASTTTTSGRDLEALVDELTLIWEDADTVQSVSSEADPAASCWDEDTAFRGGEPDGRWTFEYENDEWLVSVFFLYDDQGDHGPFQVYDLPDCESLAEVP